MNKSVLGILGLVGVALVAGCGSSDEDKGAADLGALASAQCAALQRCYPEAVSLYGGAERCPVRVRIVLDSMLLPGMNLDSQWMAGCVSALQSASCEDVVRGVSACEFPAGTLEVGAACVADTQCSTGACHQSSAPPACGACAVPAQLGESCKDKPCAKGLSCSWGGEPSVCVEESPDTPAPKEGEACDSNYGSYCGAFLRCVENVCSPLAAVGESCATEGDCGSGAYCDTTEKVCKAIEVVGEGQACEGPGADCADGLYCKGNAACAPYVEDGGECEASPSTSSGCLFPATCENGVCTLPTPDTCE